MTRTEGWTAESLNSQAVGAMAQAFTPLETSLAVSAYDPP